MAPHDDQQPELTSTRRAGRLNGAFIVLGVTGGVAAFKAIELCRALVDAGAHVVPVLSASALRFVGAATFSSLASEPAKTALFDDADPIPHTRLGRRADCIVVVPATAHFLASYASGAAPDLLGATVLASRAPVVVCPAMHTEMWEHDAVQANVATLRARGVQIVDPEHGRLAGGDVGAGRLAATARIVAAISSALGAGDLAGAQVLVTAGGTREPIDPVRYLGNRSSGKQGYAIAYEARRRGAAVTLVTTAALADPPGVAIVRVETAEELAAAVRSRAADTDVIVMSAAVADFDPKTPADEKLKKDQGLPEIILEATPDVLAELGRERRAGQVLVGFAAETTDAVDHARQKLRTKGVDLLVVNDVAAPGVGFAHDTNAVTILDRNGGQVDVPLAPKPTIAVAVVDAIVSWHASRVASDGVRTH